MQLARCWRLATELGRVTQNDIIVQSARRTMHRLLRRLHRCCHIVPAVSRAAQLTLTTVRMFTHSRSFCLESTGTRTQIHIATELDPQSDL